ncbi:hypothetical protein Deipr_2558 (plasmid) [Deinococcus proteolyticus MRP]|uniref:Uncharacterized protein n=1 Tax=Deinococcus proteolyticus (strain ATCC 35074 / DSM 20540 / JCM 6276 / NBRC 101906 / NCIMB 13154 / VKM Ac-1939 / CCM 2703 / MRP) TaxID=693977 RepID=F0RQW4_DEIPM|nr:MULTISPECIES: hypothetical protein [Deinococcus]ADY27673.1 hypothetical protein Deipr_2558 [Deinococcus proteolyticus MRP]MCY1703552.1 hypothetical protein [Deinococcus sp. SL84]
MLKHFFSLCLIAFFAASPLAAAAPLQPAGGDVVLAMSDDPTIGGRGLG